jgi:cell division protein FtsQ
LGKKPARKNRYKKSVKQRQRRWVGHLVTGLKLLSLIAVLLAASALFMVGYAAVTQSDYFRAQTITVEGFTKLSRDTILDQAQLHAGDNLLAVNLQLVRKRLLAHPWIASASVSREIPATIRVQIKEHACLAVVDLGRKFLLNETGKIFKEYEPNDPQGLPVVTGIVYSDLSLGDDARSRAMAGVIDLLRASQAKGSIIPYSEIKQVQWDPEMGISLSAWEDQRTIKFGFKQFETKFRRLKQLLPQIQHSPDWRDFNTLDVNNPNRVVMRLN